MVVFFFFVIVFNRLFQDSQSFYFSHLMWIIFHTLEGKVDLAECHLMNYVYTLHKLVPSVEVKASLSPKSFRNRAIE